VRLRPLSLISAASLTLAAACAPMPATDASGTPDQCGAAGSQSLIGRNVAAVSFPADANVRVVCTTCPTTRDYRPDRLNVRFDQDTGIIRQVDCG
jgi:hypothetical protein